MVTYYVYTCRHCGDERVTSPENEQGVVYLHNHIITHFPDLDIDDFILADHYTYKPLE